MPTPPASPQPPQEPRARVPSSKRTLEEAVQPDAPQAPLPKHPKQDFVATDVHAEEKEKSLAPSAKQSSTDQPSTQQSCTQQSPAEKPLVQQPPVQQSPVQQPSAEQTTARQSLRGASTAAALTTGQRNFIEAFFDLSPTELSQVGEAARIVYGVKTGQAIPTPFRQIVAPALPRVSQDSGPQESVPTSSRTRQEPVLQTPARASSRLEQQPVSQEPSPVSTPSEQEPVLDNTAATSNADSNDTQAASSSASTDAIKPFPAAVKDLRAAEQYATGPKAELRRWKGDSEDLPNEAERWQTAKNFYDKLTTLAAIDAATEKPPKPVKYSHEWMVLISWRLEWRIYDICNLGSFMPKHNDQSLKIPGEVHNTRSLAYTPRVEAVLGALDNKQIRKDVFDGVKDLEFAVVGAPNASVKAKDTCGKNNKDRAEKRRKEKAELEAAKAPRRTPAPPQAPVQPPTTAFKTNSEIAVTDKNKPAGSAENDDPKDIDNVAAAPSPAPVPAPAQAANSSVRSPVNDPGSVECSPASLNSPSAQDDRKTSSGTAALDPDNPAFTSGVDNAR